MKRPRILREYRGAHTRAGLRQFRGFQVTGQTQSHKEEMGFKAVAKLV